MRIRLVLFSMVILFTFTACTGDNPDESSVSEPVSVVLSSPDVPDGRLDASSRNTSGAIDPFTVAIAQTDGFFHPLYSEGDDLRIAMLTQLPLVAVDEDGVPSAGVSSPCLALDYSITISEDGESATYEFVLKKNLLFSDGTPCGGRDVVFSLYILTDPIYDGNFSISHLDIQGVRQYNAAHDKGTERDFSTESLERVRKIVAGTASLEDIHTAWERAKNLVRGDIDAVRQSFESGETIQSMTGSTAWKQDMSLEESLLAYFGLCTMLDGELVYDTSLDGINLSLLDEGTIADIIFEYLKNNVSIADYDIEFLHTIVTDGENRIASEKSMMYDFFVGEMTEYYAQIDRGSDVMISGIRLTEREFEDSISREVVSVTVLNFDPDTIEAFCFPVLGVSHYSTSELAGKADGKTEFGVVYTNREFHESVKKTMIPVGAGAYSASSPTGKAAAEAGDFYRGGVIYFSANDFFVIGAPRIKHLRFYTAGEESRLTLLESGVVQYSGVDISEYRSNQGYEKFAAIFAEASVSYSFIIDPARIVDISAREAIFHAVGSPEGGNVHSLTTLFPAHSGYAAGAGSTGISFDGTGLLSKEAFLRSDRYAESDGRVVYSGGGTVRLTFYVPDEIADHPSAAMIAAAAETLAKIGVEVVLTNDASITRDGALIKIDNSIHGDVYSKYSKESPGSLYNMLVLSYFSASGTQEEYDQYVILDDSIHVFASSYDIDERKNASAETANALCALYVELPLCIDTTPFLVNESYCDINSFNSFASAIADPLFYIWKISLN